MIVIKNVKTLEGSQIDYKIESEKTVEIDAHGEYLLLPSVIDSHVSLGEVGSSSWNINVQSALCGGVTTLFDFPDASNPCSTVSGIEQKRHDVDKNLDHLQLPLNYFLYAKAEEKHFDQIGLAKSYMMGAAIMGDFSTHVIQDEHWDKIFSIAAWEDIPIVFNAMNENIQPLKHRFEEGESLLEKAIFYAKKQNARLYFLNLSKQSEMNLINEAKKQSILIYTETTPEHLFSNDPDKEFLWDCINNKMIDLIGSGFHATLQTNVRIHYNGTNCSINHPLLLLPQLLTAYRQGKISIERIVALTRTNLKDLFPIALDRNAVIVDLERVHLAKRILGHQEEEIKLIGWPVYVVLNGRLLTPSESGYTFSGV